MIGLVTLPASVPRLMAARGNWLLQTLQSYHVDKVITSVSLTDEDEDEITVSCDEGVKILLQKSSF